MSSVSILVLCDGKAGHQSQSIGLANLFKEKYGGKIYTQRVTLRIPALNRLAHQLININLSWLTYIVSKYPDNYGATEHHENLMLSMQDLGYLQRINLSCPQGFSTFSPLANYDTQMAKVLDKLLVIPELAG